MGAEGVHNVQRLHRGGARSVAAPVTAAAKGCDRNIKGTSVKLQFEVHGEPAEVVKRTAVWGARRVCEGGVGKAGGAGCEA